MSAVGIAMVVGLSACAGGLSSTADAGGGAGSPPNRPPTADAGPDRDVLVLDSVALDAAGSSDPDGDLLQFRWALLARPAGSRAALDDPAVARPRFVPDVVGDYELELTVRDAALASVPDRLVVRAGPDQALRVGPGRELTTPSAAAAVATDGALIRIDAGDYRGDVAVWSADDLRIVAHGGAVHLFADGRAAQDKAIWVVSGARTTIEGITFEGCEVADGNGAGIRLQGGDLTARDCRFVANQMGFLCGDLADAALLFEGCEFANSHSTGALAHGIYVNRARSLELRHCYIHHASRGHCVKSRARETRILYCRIGDETDGNASYLVDLPDGGLAFLLGNTIQKGRLAQNDVLVSFAEEHAGLHPVDELHVVHNTLVNDHAAGVFVRVSAGTAWLSNDLLIGPGRPLVGAGTQVDVLRGVPDDLLDHDGFDFRLREGSTAIDAGRPIAAARGFDLTPRFEYEHVAATRVRQDPGAPDLGAFAFALPR